VVRQTLHRMNRCLMGALVDHREVALRAGKIAGAITLGEPMPEEKGAKRCDNIVTTNI